MRELQATQGIANNLVERWPFVILGEHIVEEANHMHYEREINYYDLSKNCCILSAQKCSCSMCLSNITGQIVCITQVKFAHPAIPLDQKWSTQCSLPEKNAIQSNTQTEIPNNPMFVLHSNCLQLVYILT